MSRLDSQAFVYPATVLAGRSGLQLATQGPKQLGSFATNSITREDNRIFVTTGDDDQEGGGLYVLDNNLSISRFISLDDARWVHSSENRLYVAQGTPGRITVINPDSMLVERTISVQGANIPEAKTTLDVANGLIFFAGGASGLLIIDEVSGQTLHNISFPEANAITNAVSVYNRKIFVSNGEGGIYMLRYRKNNKQKPPKILAKLSFEDSQSVNHILYRNNVLYIAAGLGGTKVVSVDD